jgi:RNA ligase-like protein
MKKPLGGKAYGHIPHLPGSRMGPGDHHCHEGQARICTDKARDRHDVVVVQQKLDGSCCAVAHLADVGIVALGRAGYLAQTSKFEQHQLFADWVGKNETRFDALLQPGEHVAGEWLAQAHGTRYQLPHEPFVIFDLFRNGERILVEELVVRAARWDFVCPGMVSWGAPVSIEKAMTALRFGGNPHGAVDGIEGAVWRVERKGKVDFLAKYVRPDKADGCYLPEVSGQPAVWNWRP